MRVRWMTCKMIRSCCKKQIKEARKGFRCCSVCETMEGYKEGYLMVWTTYKLSPCSSIVGLYVKGTCDAISVTMAMRKVHKSVL